MRYLLDSDSLSELYRPEASGHAAISRRLTALREADQIIISILSIYETEYGFANAPMEKRAEIRQRISHMQARFEVLPLTPEAARVFGSLKAGLSKARRLSSKGSKLHNIDVMLAAAAVTEDCTLVSGDSIYGDLQKIDPMLKIEDWLVTP